MTDQFEYTDEFLASVRAKLKEEIEKAEDRSLYDEKEYQKYLSDDEYFIHYVKRKKGDLNASVKFLLEVLMWKKSMGISDLHDKSFPKEFYDFGGIHVYGSDVDGNVVCHIRLRLFIKVAEILDLLKKFIVYQMLKADEEGLKKAQETGKDIGWILLFDCTEAGIANADMDMVHFMNSTLKNFFPYGQKYVLNHNVPWLLRAIKTVIFAMLPANVKQRLKFSDDKTIHEFISRDQLPYYMGGTNPEPYPLVPRGVLTTSEMAKEALFPLTPDEEAKVLKYYDKVYEMVKQSKAKIAGA